jgi:hypothetical protein
MAAVIPQAEALRLQLAAFAGNEPAGSYLEIRPLDPTAAQRFVPVRELRGAIDAVMQLRERHNVYASVAPRTEPRGGKDAVARVWTLWADCDSPEAVERLRAFKPTPSIVIASGTDGHLHAYWPLRRAVEPAWARRANLRLAHALGADRNCCDWARVMRVPASFNRKHDPPIPVRCLRLELDVFELADVVGHLGDEPRLVRPQVVRRAGLPRGGQRALTGAAGVVRQAPEGNRNAALNWAAFRLGQHVAARGVGEEQVRAELHTAAVAAGLGELEAERTIASGLRAGLAA